MATAKQLPSGSWRVRVSKTIDGQRVVHSVTAPTKAEAEYLAERWQASAVEDAKPENRTVRQLCEDYISLKEPILSPTTIAGYRKILRCNFQGILDIKARDLTRVRLQREVASEIQRGLSAKSVANAWGFVSAALRMYGYEFTVQLPERPDKVIRVASPAEILPLVIGTDIELPCLLAMWCGLSMSEIRGARLSDIRDGILYIDQVIVDVDGVPTIKDQGKEEKRTRAVALPEYIREILPTEGEYLVTMHRNTIYRHWKDICARNGLPDMTFHQLRHVFATTGAMLNLPPKVMQEMGGWKTPHTMEKVYQHTFRPEREAAQEAIDAYFERILKDD